MKRNSPRKRVLKLISERVFHQKLPLNRCQTTFAHIINPLRLSVSLKSLLKELYALRKISATFHSPKSLSKSQ